MLHDIAKGRDKHNAITYLETSLNSHVVKTHRVERGISVNSFKPRLQLLTTPQFIYTSREHGISYGKVQTFFVKVLTELSQDDIR